MARSKLMARKEAWARSKAAEIDAEIAMVLAQQRATEDREERRKLARLVALLRAQRTAYLTAYKDGRNAQNKRKWSAARKALERAEREFVKAYGHEVGYDELVPARLLASCDPRAVRF